ncbi:MAG: hypothetical protein F4Z04_13050 [Acidobacteria bacterium]|nr:hypothetical protein [Acidobacteriota bacterium]
MTDQLGDHPIATGPREPAGRRDRTNRPPTTHQPQTDWWHQGLVFKALPYCVQVVGRRAEILDRRYRLIVALLLKRVPTDQQLMTVSHSGVVRDYGDGSRKVWLYNDTCTPKVAWVSYAERLKKLGYWGGVTVRGAVSANDPFWQWVASRRAGANLRGDFIRDTRNLLDAGGNPEERIVMACPEAQVEYERLQRQYEAAHRAGR